MSVPDLVRIAYEPHYRTNAIGRFADGQFMGVIASGRGPEHPGLVAMLILFDHRGVYLRHEGFEGLPDDEAAQGRLDRVIAALPDVIFGDIAVRLFEFRAGGLRWGLVDDSGGRVERLELYPQELSFHEPWNGLYDT